MQLNRITVVEVRNVSPAYSNTFVPVAQLRYQHHVNVANAE